MPRKDRPETPDGRYFVSRGVLKRRSDPSLNDSERRRAIKALMQARMAERRALDEPVRQQARRDVERAKQALGESGPVWWDDETPPEDGLIPENTSYAEWWDALSSEEKARGE